MTPLRIAGINAMFSRRNNAELVLPGEDACGDPLFFDDFTGYANVAAIASDPRWQDVASDAAWSIDGVTQYNGHQTLKTGLTGDGGADSSFVSMATAQWTPRGHLWAQTVFRLSPSFYSALGRISNIQGPRLFDDLVSYGSEATSELQGDASNDTVTAQFLEFEAAGTTTQDGDVIDIDDLRGIWCKLTVHYERHSSNSADITAYLEDAAGVHVASIAWTPVGGGTAELLAGYFILFSQLGSTGHMDSATDWINIGEVSVYDGDVCPDPYGLLGS